MKEERQQLSKHQSTAPLRENPVELYALCEQQEKRIEAKVYRQILQLLYTRWLFARPLFESKPLAGFKQFEQVNKQLYPYTFSIAADDYIPGSKLSAWRYQKVLENLKKLESSELRWLLIARWLKQEGVCEPEQFLPADMLQGLVKEFSKLKRFSPADFKDGFLVHAWLPYFEQIQAELSVRKKQARAREEVTALGYDKKAVGYVYHKRSLIQAICAWVAVRKNKNPATLRNIYSRLYGRKDNPNLAG